MIAEQIPAALQVVDRFHIIRNINVAIHEVRRAEVSQLRHDGYEPILTGRDGAYSSGVRTSPTTRRVN
jgi:transposase